MTLLACSRKVGNGECAPLLSDVNDDDEVSIVQVVETPLPKLQLSVLCALRMLDPMNFSQIFPYVNQFMYDLHVTKDPSKVGFYSGLESVFAICQLFAIYPWGALSDRIGRRPVILVATAGLAIASISFGLSRTFYHALFSRALAGTFSGNVALLPSVLCEITDSSNQALALPIFGLWWPIGAIIGPLIGGTFSNPATRFPQYFDTHFFRRYPYSLPSFIVSSLTLSGTLYAYIFLKETLWTSRNVVSKRDVTSYGTMDEQRHISYPNPRKSLLSLPRLRALCLSCCVLSFSSTAFDVIFTLFCYTPIHEGGLAFSVSEIGYALATAGMIAAALQVVIMPTILRRFDTEKVYHFCMRLWPLTFAFLPILNIIARGGFDDETGTMSQRTLTLVWIGIGVILSIARVGCLAYCVNTLLIKQYTPNVSALGSANALVQFSICLSRAFSPAIVSFVFTRSQKWRVLGGYGWVLLLVLVSAGGNIMSSVVGREEVAPVEGGCGARDIAA
ncbi:hypothetical protein AMATHDRAFT_146063 [Amanita thiersii Skay4041]|uniref:Major facilitator superfamily (MFS) profile domain-containing protein n=1 Tax=Amanita thiersii Skay4041 TaxID=703135 RepID=A0A2A9NL68_9AGAR|nr:hypothetical protein AMATHDRAFT_146063 [Amanita thiersii Skay4041]